MEETSRTTSFLPVSFPDPVSSKLDNHNFMLQHFLFETSILLFEFLSSDGETQNHVNPKFQDWEQQDQLIMSWLLAFISNALLTRMVNLRAKVTQFKTQLHNTKKGNLSITDYLLKIINVVDLLALVGHKISVKDHIDAIFEDLIHTVEEIEALLLAQESRIEKNIKIANLSTPSLAHLITTNSSPHFTQNGSPHFNYRAGTRNSNFHSGNGMQHFRGNLTQLGRGRHGRGSWKGNNKTQCQLCGRIGHFPSSDEVFVGNALPSKKPTVPVSSTSPFVLWHNRLGHSSSHIVSLVLNKCNLPHLNKIPSLIYSACCMGKIHKANLNTLLTWTSILYSLHDAYSRFTWIYMLKHKSEAFQVFLHFKSQVELQLGHKIKVMQSDWGGEYRSFTQYLTSNGIIHRISCPYTHEQNGLAEHKHRHIVEHGLALLAQASFSFKYWDEAFRTILKNKTPLEVLFHQKPSYSELKVFGCMCYPNLRPFNHHKLQFRPIPCTFLGYSLNHKGYKCLSPNGNILISRDVIFDEHAFPFAQLQSQKQATSSFSSSSTSLPCQTSFPLMVLLSSTSCSTSSPTNPPIPLATFNHNITSHSPPSSTSPLPTHPMITQSKNDIFKPKAYLISNIPTSIPEALQLSHWKQAMTDEYLTLL
ncbi:hypothetical protein AAG906_022539 [Vitis piasezkii]